MSILHESISFLLEPLEKLAINGFSATTASMKTLRCHPILSNYVTDIPEAKDMSATKNGTLTPLPFHRCHVPNSSLNSVKSYQNRTLSETLAARLKKKYSYDKGALAALKGSREIAREHYERAEHFLQELSLSEYQPFLERTTLVHSVQNNDVYSMFTFEPLHNLPLGISRLLKDCIFLRLGSETLFTDVGSSSKVMRLFKRVRTSILRGVNEFLSSVERDSYARGLRIDFSSCGGAKSLNGLYLQSGVRGMLEARDYKGLDLLFPFVAGFIDRCCGESVTAPLTMVYTQYTDIYNTNTYHGGFRAWTEQDLSALNDSLLKFKHDTVQLFQEHHPSGLNTLKFHLLNHLCDDLRRSGGLQHVDADAFEHAHLIFKREYRQTSKRRSTAMSETVSQLQSSPHLDKSRKNGHVPFSNTNTVQSNSKQRSRDGVYLVRDGLKTDLQSISSTFSSARGLLADIEGQPSANVLSPLLGSCREEDIALVSQLGDQGTDAFPTLAQNTFCISKSDLRQVSVCIVKSAYVEGGFNLSLSDYDEAKNCINYSGDHITEHQRIYATMSFGSCKRPRFSSVLVRGEGKDGRRVLWVAKVLALLRIQGSKNRKQGEYAYVQYMECTAPVDNVEGALSCVLLRWATDDSKDHS